MFETDTQQEESLSPEGILLVDKPIGKSSFSLIAALRKILNVKKIGHCGTLDPFASGLLIILVGRNFTKLSDKLLCSDKTYIAEVFLGKATDTFDCEGQTLFENSTVPTLEQLEQALTHFQGDIQQIPPMFSAKKVQGKKLYELARKGIEIERQPSQVHMSCKLLSYNYPYAILHVECSKGTYIRSIADDLGKKLGCGAHLTALKRTKSGEFHLENALCGALLFTPSSDIRNLVCQNLCRSLCLLAP